jgi:predicted lipopolysaccharide heptosyltransferase III
MIERAKKILVINLRYIGDTIWMYPFIKNLKLNLPDAKISVLVNKGSEEFLELMPELSEVICFERQVIKTKTGFLKFIRFLREVRRDNFDTVFILSTSDRPTIIGFASGAKTRIGFKSDVWWRDFLLTEKIKKDDNNNPHMIESYLQALTYAGLKIYNRRLNIAVPDSKIRKICKKFGVLETMDKKSILVHPGARTSLRQWGVDNFAALINATAGSYRIFLIGGPDEDNIIQDILGKTKKSPAIVATDLNLLEFAALCRFSNLFIGNDSAPIHVAAATGLSVIGIYGPTLSKYCGPWTNDKALFDISTVSCRPCRQDKCIHTEKQACLNIIKPEMVINKATEVLENQKKSRVSLCD